MTKFDQPPLFLVGTRFQSMMALGIIGHLNLSTYDLVMFTRGEQTISTQDLAYSHLIEGARRVSYVPIPAPAPLILMRLLRAIGRGKRLILLAHIQNPTILLVFRLHRDLHLHTFDEGSYNISENGPYFSPPPRKLRRPMHFVMWAFFPKGPLNFAYYKSKQHYTAFAPQRNLFRNKAIKVEIPWGSVAIPSEVAQFCGARRIFVLPCIKDFQGSKVNRDRLFAIAEDCDLVVRHPRDHALPNFNSVHLRSPIEGIIYATARESPVTVLHYNSTVGHTLNDNAAITLVNVSIECVPKPSASK